MNDEIRRYVDSVIRGQSRGSMKAALDTVPAHLRDKVRAYALAELIKQKPKMFHGKP